MELQGYLAKVTRNEDSISLELESKETGSKWEGTFDAGRFKEFGPAGELDTIAGILFAGFRREREVEIRIKKQGNGTLAVEVRTTGLIKLTWVLEVGRKLSETTVQRLEKAEKKVEECESLVAELKETLAKYERTGLTRHVILEGCGRPIPMSEGALFFIDSTADMNTALGCVSTPQGHYAFNFPRLMTDIYYYSKASGNFEGLEYLPQLTTFQYWGNQPKHFDALGKCEKLTTLTIKGNPHLTNISWIAGCQKLTHVSFEGCTGLRDISALGLLKNLKEVMLKGTQVPQGTVLAGSPAVVMKYT